MPPLWKTVWRFLKKLKTELPDDSAITLLGIYPEITLISKWYMHSNFHRSTIYNRKTWKQLKCPLTDEWIKKMWYIYTMEYYSAIKKNKIIPFATSWMDPETLILSEVSQKEKDNAI